MLNIYKSNYFKERAARLAGRDLELFKRDCSFANIFLENTQIVCEEGEKRLYLLPLAYELSLSEFDYYLMGAIKVINSYLDSQMQELKAKNDREGFEELNFVKDNLAKSILAKGRRKTHENEG